MDDGHNSRSERRRNMIYYWFDPDTGTALYNTSVNGNEPEPFFDSIGEAEKVLKQQVSQEDSDPYRNMRLYSAKIQQIEYAVDVLMNQSGIDDF